MNTKTQNHAKRLQPPAPSMSALAAFVAGLDPAQTESWLEDGSDFHDVNDPARKFFRSPTHIDIFNSAPESLGAEAQWDTVHTLEHDVPLSQGRTMRIQEHFSIRSWMRWPHRAIVMLSSSVFNRKVFSIPVQGYNATEEIAKKGAFAFTVDYLGIGDSYRPADGREATRDEDIAAIRDVFKYIRFLRWVPSIDLLAEGYGSTMGPELARDSQRVQRLILSSTIYKKMVSGPNTDPVFAEAVRNAPDGYMFVPGNASDDFMKGAPQGVFDYLHQTQDGRYPTALFPVDVDFPFFDPTVSSVPGLVIHGPKDPLAGPGDAEELAKDYGDEGAKLVLIREGGHVPRVQSPDLAKEYWDAVHNFLDL